MKLFFRDHVSVIILYCVSFLLLPWIIHSLDNLSSHYFYFIFLVSFLFTIWLIGRYYRRKKLYTHLQNNTFTSDDLHLYEPQAMIEQAYSEKLRQMQYLYLTQQQRLEEQGKKKATCTFTFCPSNENAIVGYSTDDPIEIECK